MSHTTTISAIVITDIEALRSAIKELKQNGVDCDLLEKATPRAYYSNQEGMGKADYVVRLNRAKYDVGLYKVKEKEGYELRTDLFSREVSGQLGVKPSKGETTEQAAVGKLYNMYAVHAATRTAIQKGYKVTRVNNEDGSVQLRIAA